MLTFDSICLPTVVKYHINIRAIPFACLQMDEWCGASIAEIRFYISDDQFEDDYILDQEQQTALKEYIMSPDFIPILVELDKDRTRVARRQEQRMSTLNFEKKLEEKGIGDVASWADVEPADVPNCPPPPILADVWAVLRGEDSTPPVLREALLQTLVTIHTLSWKVDYLLETLKTAKDDTGAVSQQHGKMVGKHPWLKDIDLSVRNIPSTAEMVQLSTNKSVDTFTNMACVSKPLFHPHDITCHERDFRKT